jgi:hypothetical protein
MHASVMGLCTCVHIQCTARLAAAACTYKLESRPMYRCVSSLLAAVPLVASRTQLLSKFQRVVNAACATAFNLAGDASLAEPE